MVFTLASLISQVPVVLSLGSFPFSRVPSYGSRAPYTIRVPNLRSWVPTVESPVLDQGYETCIGSRVLGCSKNPRSRVPFSGYTHEIISSNSADLFTFTKEILSEKLYFSYSVNVSEKEYDKKNFHEHTHYTIGSPPNLSN